METRRFDSTNYRVPVIGQGTWYNEYDDALDAIAALRRGIDLGMTHIDTAEMHGWGMVEELIGEAISGRRNEVFLVSKVLPQHASRTDTIMACEQSLARLKTDWLDSYLLHWRGPYPLEDTIVAFEQLKRDGKIRSWGVSNFDEPDLEEAWAVAGPNRLVCNQVLYHLQERAIEHAVLPWCERHSVAVVGYSPFGHGRFPDTHSASGRVLAEIAAAHDVTPRQVALRFLMRRPSLFTIPKATTIEHVTENAGAGDLHLSDAELERIDKAFPLSSRPSMLPVL